MEKALDEELSYAARENLPVSKILERLLAIEADALIERRIERRIKDSRLPERKLLSDFDFTFQKGINQHRIMELATLSVIYPDTHGSWGSDICRVMQPMV
jgi:DNA replication protein DnaC